MVYGVVLGHSDQRTSVKCAGAVDQRLGDQRCLCVAHYKSLHCTGVSTCMLTHNKSGSIDKALVLLPSHIAMNPNTNTLYCYSMEQDESVDKH